MHARIHFLENPGSPPLHIPCTTGNPGHPERSEISFYHLGLILFPDSKKYLSRSLLCSLIAVALGEFRDDAMFICGMT